MITIILFSIIGLVFSGKLLWEEEDLRNISFVEVIVSLGVVIIAAFFGLMFAFMLPAETEVKTYQYKIVSLKDNSSMTGNFFLGSGNIDGTMNYVFYTEKNGTYKLNILDYKEASIRYDSIPRVEEYRTQMKVNGVVNYFAIDDYSSTYIIYIPEGSIKQNFTLDAL